MSVTARWLVLILMGGCAGGSDAPPRASSDESPKLTRLEAEMEQQEKPSKEDVERRSTVRAPDGKARHAERVPVTSTAGTKSEVPASILTKTKADLASRLGIETTAIRIVATESVLWQDGSLGCPKPDQAYTHAPVPGYRVVLEAGGAQYDYRVSERGFFVLCDQPAFGAPAEDSR